MKLKPLNLLLLFIIILVVLAIPVQASTFTNIKSDVGESWIKVSWNSSVTAQIYVDGALITDELSGTTRATNNTIGYYYLSKLSSNSQHTIQLVNASNASDYKVISAKTLPPASIVQILFIISVLLSIFLLFLGDDPIKVILTGALNIILCTFGRTISYNYYGMDLLFLGMAFFSGIMIIYAIYELAHESMNWF